MGQEALFELEVTRYEPPTLYSLSDRGRGQNRTSFNYVLHPRSEAETEVALACEIRARGVRRVGATLLALTLRFYERKQLMHLEAELDSRR